MVGPLSPPRPIHVVLGTAGHIDHGKTTLVRALTGVDTDRLPEEKRRGITIELGFAPLDLDGRRVGLVDVPGHERFVKNMVAGAGGIDLVLLVVAADEGVMPQTREHVEICDLLGIERGVVALSKVDRADPELAELAAEEVRAQLAGSRLADAPIVPCSAVTGEGLDALRTALIAALDRLPARPARPRLVLPIDRAFTVKGFGTVVTGTVHSGRLRVGDVVQLQPPVPGRPAPESVRVRGLQVFHEKVEQAEPGDRAAVSLGGVELAQVARGQLVVDPGACRPTRVLDARVRHLASRPRALKTGAKALFHLGTGLVECGLTLLDADRLAPGESGLVRVRLAEPVAALPGQRFILRGFDAASEAGRTVGGGRVLDPEPGRRRRLATATVEVLERLEAALDQPEAREPGIAAVTALVRERGPRGLELEPLGRRLGLDPKAAEALADRAARAKVVTRIGALLVDPAAVDALGPRLIDITRGFHDAHPFLAGVAPAELVSRLGRAIPAAVTERACAVLVGRKALLRVADGSGALALPDHQPRLGTDEARRQVVERLESAGLEPPLVPALESEIELEPKALRELLGVLARSGVLVRATPTLYFAAGPYEAFRRAVVGWLDTHGRLSTPDAKALSGVSRKYLIPLMELLDRQRVTVRDGEDRRAGPAARADDGNGATPSAGA